MDDYDLESIKADTYFRIKKKYRLTSIEASWAADRLNDAVVTTFFSEKGIIDDVKKFVRERGQAGKGKEK